MSTYTQIIYQIVFSTKNNENTLHSLHRQKLFHYIWGIVNKKNCHLYQVNGVENHIHILTHIHPSISLATLVKDIKLSSSFYIKEFRLFNDFKGWQNGYGAFTYNIKEKEKLIAYVKNQEKHHKVRTFIEEYIELLNENNINYDRKYLL
jgi:REP element-mobilizing transposase RayT